MACDIVCGRTNNNLERLDVLPDGAVDGGDQDGVSEEADEDTSSQEQSGGKATDAFEIIDDGKSFKGITLNNIDNSNNVLDVVPDGAVGKNVQDGVSEEADEDTSSQEQSGGKATDAFEICGDGGDSFKGIMLSNIDNFNNVLDVLPATDNIDNSNNVADFIQDDDFEGIIFKGVSEERNKESSDQAELNEKEDGIDIGQDKIDDFSGLDIVQKKMSSDIHVEGKAGSGSSSSSVSSTTSGSSTSSSSTSCSNSSSSDSMSEVKNSEKSSEKGTKSNDSNVSDEDDEDEVSDQDRESYKSDVPDADNVKDSSA
jgi:hypothetical protein